MQVSKNKVVSLTYELRLDSQEGELVEKVEANSPLTFIYGTGGMLPKFEEHLSDKNVGDNFKFDLSVEDGYGEHAAEAITQIPVDNFKMEGKIEEGLLEIGNIIPMQDQEGHRMNGRVLEVNETIVSLDFNHPLAGEALFFQGEITELREATEEEISHGHVHTGEHHHDDNHECDCDEKTEGCDC